MSARKQGRVATRTRASLIVLMVMTTGLHGCGSMDGLAELTQAMYGAQADPYAPSTAPVESASAGDPTFLGLNPKSSVAVGQALGKGGRDGVLEALSAYAAGVAENASNATPSHDPGATGEPPGGTYPAPLSSQAGASDPAKDASGCMANLAHLAPLLPEYNHPKLQEIRSTILREDVPAAYRRGIAAGMSPAKMASDAVAQARAAEGQLDVAKECIRKVAVSPEPIISQLEAGSFDLNGSGGVAGNCAVGYVLMYYNAVAVKALAVGYACLARQ